MAKVFDRPRELRIRSDNAGTDKVIVAVQDVGTGINDADTSELFKAFYTTKSEASAWAYRFVVQSWRPTAAALRLAPTKALARDFSSPCQCRKSDSSCRRTKRCVFQHEDHICFGSLADISGCVKNRPLYSRKQTFWAKIVGFVPLADVAGVRRVCRLCATSRPPRANIDAPVPPLISERIGEGKPSWVTSLMPWRPNSRPGGAWHCPARRYPATAAGLGRPGRCQNRVPPRRRGRCRRSGSGR